MLLTLKRLDRSDSGSVALEETFLVVALLAAVSCGQTLMFLYLHGNDMFDLAMCSCGGDTLPFPKFCELGFTVGLTAVDILNVLQVLLKHYAVRC